MMTGVDDGEKKPMPLPKKLPTLVDRVITKEIYMKTYTIICEAECDDLQSANVLARDLMMSEYVDLARVRDDADVQEFDAEQLETIATGLDAIAEIVEARPAPSDDQTATKILTIHEMHKMAQQARDLAALRQEST